jgi:ribosomal protein L21
MYAVIKTGGKQFRVVAGEKIKVEQIAADVGQEVVIDQVLAVGYPGTGSDLLLGAPLVSGATVTAIAKATPNCSSQLLLMARAAYLKQRLQLLSRHQKLSLLALLLKVAKTIWKSSKALARRLLKSWLTVAFQLSHSWLLPKQKMCQPCSKHLAAVSAWQTQHHGLSKLHCCVMARWLSSKLSLTPSSVVLKNNF